MSMKEDTREQAMTQNLRKLQLTIIMLTALTGESQGAALCGNERDSIRKNLNVGRVTDSIARTLEEVVITARESRGITSESRIDRAAMEHLQPTSFTDLLELLPGNISKDPAMGKTNSITLRETGALTATGQQSGTNDDYAISSLGTSFIMDGSPMNTDADLTAVPGASQGSPEFNRKSVNRGVDMRTLSTDNIESVEIIRGIPSSEYGNLTSGVVNIKRIRRATPFTARLKVDGFSKLVSLGKGFSPGNYGHVFNVDAGYLDSKVDPRDNLESYKRINASGRADLRFQGSMMNARLNAGIDFTATIDIATSDPDISMLKTDEYKSSCSRVALTAALTLENNSRSWFRGIDINGSASYAEDNLERRKQVSPQRASVAPASMESGVQDGRYLLGEYISDFRSEGKPVTGFLKLKARGETSFLGTAHKFKAGTEWSVAKNHGEGEIYDLARPLSASWTTRPRPFSEIPALHTLSFFAEDYISCPIGPASLDMQIGLRSIQIPSLDKRYYLAGKVYIDPRLNVLLRISQATPGGNPLELLIAGGYGINTRMPTVDYLYPAAVYNDIVQLNYYDVANPLEHSRVNLITYIEDAANYNLYAARNHKWELRLGCEWNRNSLSVSYFDESMTSGFRYSTMYVPYAYRKYDGTGIEPGSLTAPPDLSALPFTDMKVLGGVRRPENGTRIDKRGVEFQISTMRWKTLGTSLTITGAWFQSRYSNARKIFSAVNDVVGNRSVSDVYIGLYDTADGRINEQFNTNFMFDTRIKRWGLIFSTSIQCMWYVKTRRLAENGIPEAYISADDGLLHDYTENEKKDPMLMHLVKTYNDELFKPTTMPPALYVNLKATKQIGKWLRISAFVNRLIDYLPDYTSNGLTIRRNADAYFGMELRVVL